MKNVNAQIDEAFLKTVLASLRGKPLHKLIAIWAHKTGAPVAADKEADVGEKDEKKQVK